MPMQGVPSSGRNGDGISVGGHLRGSHASSRSGHGDHNRRGTICLQYAQTVQPWIHAS